MNYNLIKKVIKEEILKESNVQYNAREIARSKAVNVNNYSKESLGSKLGIKSKNDLVDFVSKTPPLVNFKIKRMLATGTHGMIYELDNDLVLKIFGEVHSEKEMDYVDNSIEALYSGKATTRTTNFIRRGETITEDGEVIRWILMSKIETLIDLFGEDEYDTLDVELEIIASLVNDNVRYNASMEEIVPNFYKLQTLSPIQAMKIFKAIYEAHKTSGMYIMGIDLTPNNVGYIPDSDSFTIFDI